MTNKEQLQWLKKLKPFLKLRDIAYDKFRKREYEIEKLMSKICKEELEFFYVDGECVGIGSSIFANRDSTSDDYYPLFHNEEIESGKLNDF